ncbi:MAG: molybdopterin oxidoreductase family protein [Acidobacteria bacterium]|nr:molybdopterin oxidoreductase family protein [Acidobacteriota bacterium]
MTAAAQSQPKPTATHCPYCALQCGVLLTGARADIALHGNVAFPVNQGALCIKGWTATEVLNHEERLLRPLKRNARGVLAPVEWDEALDTIAAAFKATQAKYGRDAVGMLGGGSLTNEKAYLLGKFARVALRTANVDYNGRFCMASAAAAANQAFGIDRGLPFPVADIAGAEVILLVGANPAETMPPLMQHFEKQRANGGTLIVVDPRQTLTAQAAHVHLRGMPGSDAALANGLLHLLIREQLLDEAYIAARTENFAAVKAVAATYWPDRVERLTGVSESQLLQTARLLGHARSAMILTARGAEQHAQGVNNTLAFINLALALGLPGKACSGFGTITGQGNGQGGREHGQKADQLPGYRSIHDAAARQYIAEVWGINASELPGAGKSAYELLQALGGEIKALFALGFNFMVSAPDAHQISARLNQLDFFCTADFFLSETARVADVVLPSAQWAEEEGTLTNLEGRVIRRRRALWPPEEARSDIETLCALAARLGCREQFSYADSEAVFNELRRASAGGLADYSGISYARLDAGEALHWPCPEGSEGTPRLFSESFPTPTGKARFHAVQHQAAVEEPDAEFPLYLTTGRVLAQYQTGAMTRRIAKLNAASGEPCAELHPQVAQRYCLQAGAAITLVTRRGRAQFKVKLTRGIRPDTIFVPFHWGAEQSANHLTIGALDPVSRMPEFKVCAVRIEPALTQNSPFLTLNSLAERQPN